MSNFEINGWKFRTKKTPMLLDEERTSWMEEMKCHFFPEMIFNSEIEFEDKNSGFKILMNAKDGLRAALRKPMEDYPKIKPVQVIFAWNKKKIKEDAVDKFQDREDNIDWTYSTVYGGTITNEKSIEKDSVNEMINYDMLKDTNEKILFYDELSLYEDELHDCGICSLSVKFRVMPKCFFILIRFFLRVDNVLFRIVDTRIFHEFGKNFLIREYQLKQDTVSNVVAISANDGGKSSGMLAIDVDPLLPVIERRKEKITF